MKTNRLLTLTLSACVLSAIATGVIQIRAQKTTSADLPRRAQPSATPISIQEEESEPECIFNPPQSTNAINAPCFTTITAVATDNQGATASSAVIIHFTPKPDPSPPCISKYCR